MDKKESNYLEVLKNKLLKTKTIAWLVVIVMIIGAIAALLQNLQTITSFLKSAKPSISLVSYGLDTDESIFEEEGALSFHLPQKKRFIMINLSLLKEDRVDPKSLSAMNHALKFLFSEQRKKNIPIDSNELNEIFRKKDKLALLKLIAPADPKNPRYDNFDESRLELFDIVEKIFTEESMKVGGGYTREYIRPYRPFLMGRFEPIFNLILHNNGEQTGIIDRIDIVVRSVSPRKAGVTAGPIPVVGIVDVTIPSKKGTTSKKLTKPFQIPPDESGIIQVRMNTEAQSLKMYGLKIEVRGPDVEASTDFFQLEM